MMPFNNPIKDAWNAPGGVNRGTLAALAESRGMICLDGLAVADFVAGTTPAFVYGGKLWTRDALDTTSPHDGVAVIVTSDGKRFKSSLLAPLERGIVAVTDFRSSPPSSPALGDAYGVGAAPTGAWAGWAGRIAVCLYGGAAPVWGSVLPARNLVAVTAAGMFRTWTGAAWQDGFGASYVAGSVPAEALKVPTYAIEAELTAPPGSPADGLYWLVAAGATGAWSGRDGQIAARVAGAWTYIAPVVGARAWSKAGSLWRIYYGGAWRDDQLQRITQYPARVARATTLALVATGWSPSWTSAPTTGMGAQVFPEGSTSIKFQASRSTSRIALTVELHFTGSGVAGEVSVAVFIDAEGMARSTMWTRHDVKDSTVITARVEYVPGDTSVHEFVVRAMGAGTIYRAFAQVTEIDA